MPLALPSLPGLSWSRHKKPAFSTRVASHVSGREVRLPLMSYPLYEFEAVYAGLASSATAAFANLGASSLQSLMGFFLQLLGQAGVFLYTDPDDNTVSGQSIGAGDGTTQIFIMPRTLGGFSEPVSYVTAVSNVYLNGSAQASANWQFTAPNMLAFATPPGSAVAIAADFSFAFQCRFLDDQLDFEEFMSALWRLDKMGFRSIKANTSTSVAVIPSWYTPYAIGAATPYGFADFSTEGGSNHYLWNGATYSSGAAWLAAAGGTYVNSSGKHVTNASGLLASVASNTLPFDHDALGNPLGLLLEGASTNTCLDSNNFTTANWYNPSSVATQNAVGPDGVSNSAWTCTVPSTGLSRLLQTSAASAGAASASWYVKAGSQSHTALWSVESGGGQALSWFTLSGAGAVGTTNHAVSGSPAGSFSNLKVTQLANGWYRLSGYYSVAAQFGVWFTDADGSTSSAVGGTAIAFGSQVEALSFASSYIPAGSTSTTRAADGLYIPWTATTFTARVKAAMTAEVDNGRLLGAGSGGLLYQSSGPDAATNNGSVTLSAAVNAWAAQNIVVLGGSSSARILSANGNAAAIDSNALVPSAPSHLYVGADSSGGNTSDGHFVQVGLWNAAPTGAQVAALSGTI